MLRHHLRQFRSGTAKFAGDGSAVAAIEFALILPILILLAFGMFDTAQLVRMEMKLDHAVGALAKMVAQQQSVTGGQSDVLGNLCTGASFDMLPFSRSSFSAAILSVTHNKTTSTTALDWESDNSCPLAASQVGATAAVNTANAYGLVPNAGDSTIIVQATYTYKPVMRMLFGSSFSITKVGYARPRTGTTIPCGNC